MKLNLKQQKLVQRLKTRNWFVLTAWNFNFFFKKNHMYFSTSSIRFYLFIWKNNIEQKTNSTWLIKAEWKNWFLSDRKQKMLSIKFVLLQLVEVKLRWCLRLAEQSAAELAALLAVLAALLSLFLTIHLADSPRVAKFLPQLDPAQL